MRKIIELGCVSIETKDAVVSPLDFDGEYCLIESTLTPCSFDTVNADTCEVASGVQGRQCQ